MEFENVRKNIARQLDIPVWSRQEIEAIKEAWGEECFTKKA